MNVTFELQFNDWMFALFARTVVRPIKIPFRSTYSLDDEAVPLQW